MSLYHPTLSMWLLCYDYWNSPQGSKLFICLTIVVLLQTLLALIYDNYFAKQVPIQFMWLITLIPKLSIVQCLAFIIGIWGILLCARQAYQMSVHKVLNSELLCHWWEICHVICIRNQILARKPRWSCHYIFNTSYTIGSTGDYEDS